MDVDGPASERRAQLGRENLHIAGEQDEFDVVLLDRLEDARLHSRLLGGRLDRPRLEGHFVAGGAAGVVAEHERDIDGQVRAALAEQQVGSHLAGWCDFWPSCVAVV